MYPDQMTESDQEPMMANKLMQLSDFAFRKAHPGLILLLLGLVACFNLLIFPGFTEHIVQEGAPAILDVRLGYHADEAYNALTAFGEEGRQYYLRMLIWADSIYPILYGVLLILSLSYILNKVSARNSPMRIWNLLPIDAVLFDYTENISMIYMLRVFPDYAGNAASIASVAGIIKWGIVVVCLVMILAGAIKWAWLSFQKRER